MDAERRATFGALQVRHQRRHREPRHRERALRHLLGVGELRQQLRRHERAHLDIAHAGRDFGLDPGELQICRHDRLDVLDAVAQPDFADLDEFGHELLLMLSRR